MSTDSAPAASYSKMPSLDEMEPTGGDLDLKELFLQPILEEKDGKTSQKQLSKNEEKELLDQYRKKMQEEGKRSKGEGFVEGFKPAESPFPKVRTATKRSRLDVDAKKMVRELLAEEEALSSASALVMPMLLQPTIRAIPISPHAAIPYPFHNSVQPGLGGVSVIRIPPMPYPYIPQPSAVIAASDNTPAIYAFSDRLKFGDSNPNKNLRYSSKQFPVERIAIAQSGTPFTETSPRLFSAMVAVQPQEAIGNRKDSQIVQKPISLHLLPYSTNDRPVRSDAQHLRETRRVNVIPVQLTPARLPNPVAFDRKTERIPSSPRSKKVNL